MASRRWMIALAWSYSSYQWHTMYQSRPPPPALHLNTIQKYKFMRPYFSFTLAIVGKYKTPSCLEIGVGLCWFNFIWGGWKFRIVLRHERPTYGLRSASLQPHQRLNLPRKLIISPHYNSIFFNFTKIQRSSWTSTSHLTLEKSPPISKVCLTLWSDAGKIIMEIVVEIIVI